MNYNSKTKLVFWTAIACIVAPLVYYFLIRPAFPKQSRVSGWMTQAHALDQLGMVLQAFEGEHSGASPNSLSALKAWAADNPEFREVKNAKFWNFVDPGSGLIEEWILCSPPHKLIRIYAPRPKLEKDQKDAKRLILTPEYNWKFISESEFIVSGVTSQPK